MQISSKVPSNVAGGTVGRYLAARFSYRTIAQWEEWISEGRILLNGRICRAEEYIGPGDTLSCILPENKEPAADCNFTVVYEDEWIMGINKPGNLLVHRAGASIRTNLAYLLRYGSDNPAYRNTDIVNRLDRETSGVVLVTKNKETLKTLNVLLRNNGIRKEYLAVVHNHPPDGLESIHEPIGRDLLSMISYKFRIDRQKGKPSCTKITRVRLLGPRHALLTLEPITGRTHQIRIHCVSAGCPVVGDKLYGMTENDYCRWRKNPQIQETQFELSRQALHCSSMSFFHPHLNREVTIRAPLPDDLQTLIRTLRKNEEYAGEQPEPLLDGV